MKIAAFIPARSGSKRVKNKNIKTLGSKPLIAHTLDLITKTDIFDIKLVSSDSNDILSIVKSYKDLIPLKRPINISGEKSPDIDWVLHAINHLKDSDIFPDIIFILRPTSPFRSEEYLVKALKIFNDNQPADSLRGIEKVKEHPGKMWKLDGNYIEPLINKKTKKGIPWHSSQYQSLPEFYIQNASIEIAWTKSIVNTQTISGNKIIPYISSSIDSFDINSEIDFKNAENLIGKIDL